MGRFIVSIWYGTGNLNIIFTIFLIYLSYTNITSFKKRHAVHLHSFIYPEKTNIQTSLSNYIHELENRNIEFNLSWKILDRGMPFNPISETCDLCLKEKFHILKEMNPNQLNSRNEIFSNCKHKHSVLLIPRDRKKKRKPGWNPKGIKILKFLIF